MASIWLEISDISSKFSALWSCWKEDAFYALDLGWSSYLSYLFLPTFQVFKTQAFFFKIEENNGCANFPFILLFLSVSLRIFQQINSESALGY